MQELMREFPGTPIGLSDHTINNLSSYAAISLGASVIEKHFTDNKKSNGPDMTSSMDVNDLKNMLNACETIPKTLPGHKKPVKKELKTIKFAFASIACLLYTSPSPRDRTRSRMPSSA